VLHFVPPLQHTRGAWSLSLLANRARSGPATAKFRALQMVIITVLEVEASGVSHLYSLP
jgi:hypothetical protein